MGVFVIDLSVPPAVDYTAAFESPFQGFGQCEVFHHLRIHRHGIDHAGMQDEPGRIREFNVPVRIHFQATTNER
mgnify:CR=1 FL=1